MGTVTFIDDINEKKHSLKTMIKQQETIPDEVIKKQKKEEELKNVNIGRIDITYLTGKKSDKAIISQNVNL